ncbi:hypothetical protein B0I35DRAFT_474523 [Stachybotrys elegans]|uniref:Uncharacterized protein n=1 Tax=Stachybotrys elegans TaxID=80388 RepID=A0A8K0WV50_9HYPO|nr:hypothetical protein B0I35DRAFT_474523 [Stachybotrys elegans]
MVLFVDLDEEEAGPSSPIGPGIGRDVITAAEQQQQLQKPHQHHDTQPHSIPRPAPFHSPATEAFQCYPVVVAIASSIDLNTLDSLARTCRLIHDGLLQYRTTLLASTLRCCNQDVPVDRDETLRYRARAGNWHYMEDGRNYNGKSGDCARDLVGECRRCAEVICRNCTIKPPAQVALRERHRRLCKACVRAPIAKLLGPSFDADLPLTSDIVQSAICRCDTDGVWLCQPCGRSIRAADHEYRSIWRWRDHYGEVLGGLGTGIGDGDRGVICGRDEQCCAAKEREQETDCDAEDAKDNSVALWSPEHPSPPAATNTPPPGVGYPFGSPAAQTASLESLGVTDESLASLSRTPTPQLGPGYERHEIEGIGGVVKRKLVRMVRVGACVPEWEDEKGGGGRILGREVRGEARSWCGWCWRVIPGRADYTGEKIESPVLRRRELA